MSDLSMTRIHAAEHSYPTPTRNHLSMHNREASKRAMHRPTKGGEVRIGIRTPDGTTVMGMTDSEVEAVRRAERENRLFDIAERKRRMMNNLAERMAEIDSWAHKA